MSEVVKSIVDVIKDLIVKFELSEAQQEFIRKQSRVRSAKYFEKNALRIMGNAELKENWVYNGYHDTGYMGGGKCSLGHTLRYVHFAHNNVTDETIRFGVKCVGDFFNLSKEQLKMIAHGVAEANEEILSSLKWLEQTHSFEEYVAMGDIFGIFDDVKQHIDKTHQEEIQAWRDAMLPLPYRLQAVVNRANRQKNNSTEFDEYLNNHLEEKALYEKAQEFVNNPKYGKYLTIVKAVKEIIGGIVYYKNLPDWQKAKLKKYMETDYDKIEEIVADLKIVQDQFRMGDFSCSIAVDIMGKYTQYGVSEKQMAILEKVHSKYATRIDEMKIASC